MIRGSFNHPTLGAIGFEFEMPTRDTDGYIASFQPDHEDYPEHVAADDAPADWLPLAEANLGMAMAEVDAYLGQGGDE